MRLTRLFTPVSAPSFRLDEDSAHHLKVLRLRPGDRFIAVDQGRDWLCELGRGWQARVLEERDPRPEPRVPLHLYLALVKGERFDAAVEMTSELGIDTLIPLESRRTAVEAPGPTRQARWERLARSAVSLSGRAHCPRVAEPLGFAAALQSCPPGVLFAPGHPPLEKLPEGEALSVWVGPEGGFSPEEVEGASRRGLTLAGLGPRILRVETAAAAAVTVMLRLLGEL